MENRKIIIVDSATNSKVTLTTDCTTFGELKALARQAGVNFADKDWLEGITKTQPVSDDSLLPTNVNYKGTVTNNLVYMITDTNKKTKSGIDRKELFDMVKKLGIAETLKAKYGKHYTNLKTDILAKEVTLASQISQKDAEVEPKTITTTPTVEESNIDYKSKFEALVYGVACLLANIDEATANAIQVEYDRIIEECEETAPNDVSFSDDELAEMFD